MHTRARASTTDVQVVADAKKSSAYGHTPAFSIVPHKECLPGHSIEYVNSEVGPEQVVCTQCGRGYYLDAAYDKCQPCTTPLVHDLSIYPIHLYFISSRLFTIRVCSSIHRS